MTALTIRRPNSVHQKVKGPAARRAISVNQFIASATAEKMLSVLTLDYLKSEAKLGNRNAFDHYMSQVSNVQPEAGDAL